MQNEMVGHETDTSPTGLLGLSTESAPLQLEPLYVNAFPATSTATQNVLVGHETADKLLPLVAESIFSPLLQLDPLYVNASPPLGPWETAMQNLVVAQDTPEKLLWLPDITFVGELQLS
jgi:hypothetical protein